MTGCWTPSLPIHGHISLFGMPPCRVWQVGEGVSPALDVGGVIARRRRQCQQQTAQDGSGCAPLVKRGPLSRLPCRCDSLRFETRTDPRSTRCRSLPLDRHTCVGGV